MDVEHILLMPIPRGGGSDRIIWPYTKDMETQVQYVYQLSGGTEEGKLTSSHNNTIWRDIWSSETMPKINNYMWRLTENVIPINYNQNRRGTNINPGCPICRKVEIREQMVFGYSWTEPVYLES